MTGFWSIGSDRWRIPFVPGHRVREIETGEEAIVHAIYPESEKENLELLLPDGTYTRRDYREWEAVPLDTLGWHTIQGEHLLDLLRQVRDGDDPDHVFAEMWANAQHERVIPTVPPVLSGEDGETVFVPRAGTDDTELAARERALREGFSVTRMDAEEVEMLPVPEHFIGIEYEWATVKPGTLGAVAYWRFQF